MELSRPHRLGRRAFSALAGTTVLGLALGGSVSSAA
ncbi:secreted beta-galactosidase, partial [Streptomyces coelicoflavus ZG0656]